MKKPMTNAEAIKYLRVKAGWSQQKAADELGLANRNVVWAREQEYRTTAKYEHVLAMMYATGIDLRGTNENWESECSSTPSEHPWAVASRALEQRLRDSGITLTEVTGTADSQLNSPSPGRVKRIVNIVPNGVRRSDK